MDEMRTILIIAGLVLLVAIYWMGRRDERRALERKNSRQPAADTSVEPKGSWLDGAETAEPLLEHVDYDSFYLGEDENDDDVFIGTQAKSSRVEQSKIVQTSARPTYSTASKTLASSKSETVMVSASELAQQTVELPSDVEPLLIFLTVMAPKDMSFDPYYLKQTLDNCGLVHGDMNIYHYYRKPKLEFEVNRGQRLFSVANIVEPGFFDPEDMETYRSPGIALFLQLPGPIDGVLAFEKMHQVAVMLTKQLSGILCDDKRNKITPQAVTHIKDQISEYNLKLRTRLKRTVH